MKKIINTMLAVALAAIAVHTFDAFAVSRAQRNQMRKDLLRKKLVAQKRIPAGRRGRAKRVAPIKNKSPEIQKQDKQMDQQIAQNTKALEQAAAQKEKATTPAQKAVATKKVHEAAQALLNSISDKRTWERDIYSGYEQKEIDEAKLLIEKLTDAKKKIEAKVTKKKEQLAQVTSKGWLFNTPLWNAPIKGKEAEYNKISEEIRKLNDMLDRIDAALNNQAVIAGAWSNAYKALVGVSTVAAGAAIGNVALYGSAGAVGKTAIGAKAALGSVASWATEKSGGTWEWAKWVGQYGLKTAGTLLSLYKAYTFANNTYQTALAGYNAAFGEQQKKNPNTTPEQIAAALAKEKADLDAKKAAFETEKQKFDTELAQARAQKGRK